MKISELQDKTIINISDGSNIGKISDLEIDKDGKIINIYSMTKKFFFKFSNKESIFTINQVVKIGEDVILVELD